MTAVRQIKVREGEDTTSPHQRRLKLSDGVVENQTCMYTGNQEIPELKQYCTIKVHDFSIHHNHSLPEKSILQVSNIDIIRTAEVSKGKLHRHRLKKL